MSWAPTEGPGRRGQPVSSQYLEDRINMYISAMDRASSINDESMGSQLQRDIQHLVDLMEKINSGQTVTDIEVPPPLVMTPNNDIVANPLGELSSRLSDYHKALYFAEEELSEVRLTKIQNLQKGLQTIHSLQKRAQAGFPIKENEIPPPVSIPSDSEFDNDAVNTLSTRLEQYKNALSVAESSTGTDRRRIPKLESNIRTLEFLLTRAKANRPVWRRDIPPEFDYYCEQSPEMKAKFANIAKFTLQARALHIRASKLQVTNPDLQAAKDSITEGLGKLITKWTESKTVNCALDAPALERFTFLVKELETNVELELQVTEATRKRSESDLVIIDLRIKEYKTAALKAKREGDVTQAIKNLKVVKGLQPMRDALQKGEKVDMSLVPPPPKEPTPQGELPPSFTTITDPPSVSAEGTHVSAHAQVSPFNLKPAPETAEDKLARKLTSFLEDEGGMKSTSSSSSLESDLSPPHNSDTTGEKLKTSLETEKEVVPNLKQNSASISDVSDSKGTTLLEDNSSIRTDSNTYDSKGSSSNSFEDGSRPVEEIDVSSVDNLACLADDNANTSSSLSLEAEIDNAQSLGIQNQISDNTRQDISDENSVLTDEQKETVTENEIRCEKGESEKNSKESAMPSDEGKKEKITSSQRDSKNPLDAIGFLACQDVSNYSLAERTNQANIINAVQNSSPAHVSHVPQQNSPLAQTETNNGDNKHSTSDSQNRLEKQNVAENGPDVNQITEADSGSKDSLSNSCVEKPASKNNEQPVNAESIKEDTMSTWNCPSLEGSLNSNQSYTEIKENDLPTLETSTVSLPYSVNNQSITGSGISCPTQDNALNVTSTTEHDQPFSDNIQKGLETSEAKVDDRGFEDSSDQQEFQDLMDSMSVTLDETNKTSSVMSLPSESIISHQSAGENLNSNLASSSDVDFVKKNDPISSASIVSSIVSSSPALITENINNSMNPVLVEKHSTAISGTTTLNPPNENSSTTLDAQMIASAASGAQFNQHELNKDYRVMTSQADSSPQNVELTGLETLKYDMLLASNKMSEANKAESVQLKDQMEKIKDHLRKGGRKTWEEYKECLEKELQLLNDGVKSCGDRQEWDTYKYLNNKRMLNERELSYLQKHIVEIKD